MAFPEPSNLTRVDEFLRYTNMVSDNLFGTLVLIVIYIISLVMFSKWGMKTSFAVSSYIAAILAVFFKLLGIINELALIIAIIVVAIATVSLFIRLLTRGP